MEGLIVVGIIGIIALLVAWILMPFFILGTNKRLETANSHLSTQNGWLDTLVNGSAKDSRIDLLQKVEELKQINKENLEIQKRILAMLEK